MDSLERAFDRMAAGYDELPFVKNRDWAQEVNLLGQLVPGLSQKTVLDIGCGTGSLTLALDDLGAKVLGIDLSPRMLDVANGKRRGLFERWDFLELRAEASFDVAVSTLGGAFGLVPSGEDPLEHSLRLFTKLNHVLRPGGLAVIEFLSLSGLVRGLTAAEAASGAFDHGEGLVDTGEGYSEKAYSPGELKLYARFSGFQVEAFYGKNREGLGPLTVDSPVGWLKVTKVENLSPESRGSKQPVLQEYSEQWPHQFQQIARFFADQLTDLVRIEHVGSTSIPGMLAKPILDIDIEVATPAAFASAKAQLEALGYLHVGDQGIPGREAFRRGSSQTHWLDQIAHHLYVCVSGSVELAQHLRFRDTLRANPPLRDEYNRIKREILAQVGADNRSGYVRTKETDYGWFFSQVLSR